MSTSIPTSDYRCNETAQIFQPSAPLSPPSPHTSTGHIDRPSPPLLHNANPPYVQSCQSSHLLHKLAVPVDLAPCRRPVVIVPSPPRAADPDHPNLQQVRLEQVRAVLQAQSRTHGNHRKRKCVTKPSTPETFQMVPPRYLTHVPETWATESPPEPTRAMPNTPQPSSHRHAESKVRVSAWYAPCAPCQSPSSWSHAWKAELAAPYRRPPRHPLGPAVRSSWAPLASLLG